jgi:cell division septum initiation protein DivIVA
MKLKTADAGKTVQDTRKQAKETLADAQRQARRTVKDARRQARRQLFQARVAAARARAGTQAKASRISAKAVGAAGVVGLVAGYFLSERTRRQEEHETGPVEGKPHQANDADEVPAAESLLHTS